jgi:hypothetical protein
MKIIFNKKGEIFARSSADNRKLIGYDGIKGSFSVKIALELLNCSLS